MEKKIIILTKEQKNKLEKAGHKAEKLVDMIRFELEKTFAYYHLETVK